MKTMKNKLIALLLTAVMVIAMFPAMALAADGAKVTVTADKATVKAGDTVTFTVSVTSDVILGTLSFNLNIPESVTFVENSGTLLKTASDLGITSGELSFTNISKYYILSDPLGDGNVVGTCDLMTFQCKVNDNATGSISVGITPQDAYDTSNSLVNFDKADATVTVCEHANTKQVDNGDGTHEIVCTDCDKIVTANQPHTYGQWTPCSDDNTKHQGLCACGNTVTQDHSGGTATCTQKAICDKCHQPYGDVDENKHDMTGWGHDDGINGKHFQHCRNGCGKTVEEDCRGGTATCQAPAVCEVCDVNYGELGSHVYDENAWTPDANGTTHSHKCTVCQDDETLVQKNHVDSNNDKKCDKCGYDMTCRHTGGNATCTQKAVCTKCGEEYGELAPHQFNVLQHDETQHWKDCAVCGAPNTKVAHSSTGDHVATCQHPATCDDCGQVYGDLADHNYNVLVSEGGYHWYKCATCPDINEATRAKCDGGEATCKDKAVCSVCHQPYGDVDTSKHTGGTANCTEPAVCTVCNKPYGSVNPNNHKNLETVDHVNATCTADGATGTGYCSACDTTIGTSEPIKALGHQYGAPTFTWADDNATCTATFTCTREGCTEQQENHAVIKDCTVTSETTKSTCKEAGKTVYTATVSFDDYNKGVECKDIKTVDLLLAEHTYGNEIPEAPATCTENGTKAHFECSVCGKLFVLDGERYAAASAEDLVIPATDHDWGDWEVTTPATCTAEGSQTRVCKNDRSHTETQAIAKLAHNYKDGKCVVCGAPDPNFKPADNTPTDPTKPATGDAGVGVWVALLSVSALLGTAIVVKKRHA